jgi:hypothetical protein
MKLLRNQQGVALITSLLLMLISLAIVMALLYMVMQGTNMSASHKRYKTALEASHGGVQVFTNELIPKIFAGYSSGKLETDFSMINLKMESGSCLNQKLNNATGNWGGVCAANSKLVDPKTLPDITFNLSGPADTRFKVYAKIVDTAPGNSDMSGFELLDGGAGVTGASSGVAPKHIPAVYRIEVQGEKEQNPREKAGLAVLYAY